MTLPTESARRRALSSIILVIASTLIEGIFGALMIDSVSATSFEGECAAEVEFVGEPSGSSAGAEGAEAAAAAFAALAPDFAAEPSAFAEGMIALAPPGFTTLAGGPAGGDWCLIANVSVGAATNGFALAIGATIAAGAGFSLREK